MIRLQSATGTTEMAATDLAAVSQVFAAMQENEPIDTWNLSDFSQTSVEQFVGFVKTTAIETKLPTELSSEQFEWSPFLLARSNNEVMELLLLANYVQCVRLFQLCCLRLGCLMMIPQHAAMAHFFDLPLSVPSDELVDAHAN